MAGIGIAAELAAVDDTIRQAWELLLSEHIRLDQLYAASPHTAALYWAGYDAGLEAGLAAAEERVRQAEHESDRFYLRTMNEPDRAAEIERRLDASLEAMPEHVETHSADYFARAFSGIYADKQVAA